MQLLWAWCMLLFFTAPLLAQPGGGGGLGIGNLYNKRLQKIYMADDTALHIRTFILRGDAVYQETFLHDAWLQGNGSIRISRSLHGFGLPPTDDVDEDRYTDRRSDQRIFIVYGKDTMIIDLLGIIGENGAGYSDQMDSLVIQKGWYKYYRSKQTGPDSYSNIEKLRKYLVNGFTPYTIRYLSGEGYIEYNAVTDISFLQKDKLPASYYFKRAAHHLTNKQPSLALADIATGIEKSNGIAGCEALYLLTETYAAMGQYEKAIDNISLALDCNRYSWNEPWENKVENYTTRIELLTKLRKYDKALADYNTILSITKDTTRAISARADYRSRYLHDYAGARHDLLTLVNAIPADHLSDHPQGTSEYADVYFALGTVEYTMGDVFTAARHWLKAEEFGYSSSGSTEHVRFFDSIIRMNGNIPGLYLSRALAQFKRGPYLGWGAETTRCFEQSLEDIGKAEHTGMNDYRTNMYRARVLTLLKRYNDAMKEINIAIPKKNSDPRCYLFRYEIRSKLGQTKWGDNNDVDYQRYLLLCKQWRWEGF